LLGLAAKAPEFEDWYRTAAPGLSEGPLLKPGDPLASAKAFLEAEYKGSRLLWHAGNFYGWKRSHYAAVDDGTLEAALYRFLEHARQPAAQGATAPFQPNRAKVGDVLHTLRAHVHVAGELTPPCGFNRHR
jgi:hypothetical protein